jgi:hypothetical protein
MPPASKGTELSKVGKVQGPIHHTAVIIATKLLSWQDIMVIEIAYNLASDSFLEELTYTF